MNEVTYLCPPEYPDLDSAQIETLCRDLGPHAAEDVVCRAMEELAQRLCQVQDMAFSGPRKEMYKLLRSLAAIARQIGMVSLAQVAQDVMTCIEHDDRVAEAACVARLARTGERSLTQLWDLNEFSL